MNLWKRIADAARHFGKPTGEVYWNRLERRACDALDRAESQVVKRFPLREAAPRAGEPSMTDLRQTTVSSMGGKQWVNTIAAQVEQTGKGH